MKLIRQNQPYIEKSFKSSFITAILGSRRVGKSTFAESYAEKHPQQKWVFLNMDRLVERKRVVAGELAALIEESSKQKIGTAPKLWILIDEAQKCPEAFDQIKVIYDAFKDKGIIKFILTVSGYLSLHQLSAETLAGRIELYYLREFDLKETTEFRTHTMIPTHSILEAACTSQNPENVEHAIRELSPFRALLEEDLKFLLIWGGLPEVLQQSDDSERIRYLGNYLQTYLEKDVRAISQISDLNLYQKLMEVAAEQTCSVRNDTRMLHALGCSRDTLKKYRSYLSATIFYEEVYPFIDSSLKRLVKSPKGYLTNNGLISFLTGIHDIGLLSKSGLIGHRFENWFLKELQVWLDRSPYRSKIYYWRTTGGVEIDFVVDKKPYIFPFEVTYSQQIVQKKLKHLQIFLAEEAKAPFGFYIYNGKFFYNKESRIYFIPAWAVG
jgi:predicted AAA+ superfamily ATPase